MAGARARADVGAVVALDHVNLAVPDFLAGQFFFADGLGLTPDPGTSFRRRGGPGVAWYNLGQQQFHVLAPAPGEAPAAADVVRGRFHLALGGSLRALLGRLRALEEAGVFAGTPFGFRPVSEVEGGGGPAAASPSATSPLSGRLGWLASPAGGGGSAAEAPLLRVEVDCPWGNRFNVWPKGRGPPLLEGGGGGGGGGGGLGWAPFTPGVGISCVELECEAGRAKAIGRFYRDYLMARVSAPGVDGAAEVWVGPDTRLLFREAEGAIAEGFLGSEWHLALMTADFSMTYDRLNAAELIYNDNRFRDKCHNLEDALGNSQFRFQYIVASEEICVGEAQDRDRLVAGSILHQLHHEVRNLSHPCWGRTLYNRPEMDGEPML